MTRALDTNIVVRVLADRDSALYPVALQAMEQSFVLPMTVALETEWVLRSFYGWTRDEIVAGLRNVLDLPALAVQPLGLPWILDRYAAGADFADMVHLATASGAAAFATLDRGIAHDAGVDSPLPIEILS